MEQEKLLRKITKILDSLGISYIITGGIAVVVWGRPRFTADIDIVVELLPKHLDKLAVALLKIDKEAYVDKQMMQRAFERKGEFNFIHPASGLKVDFWVLKDELFDRTRIKRRKIKKIGSTKIYLTSPEDLILIKLLWHAKTESTRQLEDIESVLRIQKKLNWSYLKKWAKIQSTWRTLDTLRKKAIDS